MYLATLLTVFSQSSHELEIRCKKIASPGRPETPQAEGLKQPVS